MIRVIRQSEIKEFKTCRRNWMLSYVRNLTSRERDVDLSDLGTIVHGALSEYYLGRPWNAWVTAEQEKVPAGEEAKWKDTYVLARIMVEGYVEWVEESGQDVGLVPKGVEKNLLVPFGTYGGDEVHLSARLDLVVNDEALDLDFLFDHKTVSGLDQAAATLQFDFQLLTYATMLRMVGTPVAGAIHNSLKRVKRTASAKPPFYGRNRVSFNDTQLRNHWKHLHGTLTEMVHVMQTVEVDSEAHQLLAPPSPDRDCSWRCQFIHVCPMMDDGSNWEGFLSQFYTPRLESA